MNINRYKRRRLRSIQPILTRVQFRDLGQKMLGFKSFRQSVEYLMDPYNYFKLSKVKMAELHQYLLDKGITTQKCPSTHIRQGDHARVLISILFPGYPIIKASEHHYQDLRENRSPQAKLIDLAYDKLPTTDKYERLDELFRVDNVKSSVTIPLKKLHRSIVVEGHASSSLNVRLFLYFWTSEFMAWTPSDNFQLLMDSKDCLTESDRKIHLDGFKHIDITQKSEKIQKANRRSTGSITFDFAFGKGPSVTVRHVSVCAVIEKTEEELASQLYVQTAALYIGKAMERSSKKTVPLEQEERVQHRVVQLLKEYDANAHDRLNLNKMERLFLSCGNTFITEWNDDEGEEQQQEDDNLEIFTGNEVITLLDPITLQKIQHPTRCIFCKHNTCFDAIVFFKFQVTSMSWKCPVCFVKIRGIQDLYIDYQLKMTLIKYPEEDKFIRESNNVYSVVQQSQSNATLNDGMENKKRTYNVISIIDDQEEPSSEKRVKI